jgi:hypothetical protein
MRKLPSRSSAGRRRFEQGLVRDPKGSGLHRFREQGNVVGRRTSMTRRTSSTARPASERRRRTRSSTAGGTDHGRSEAVADGRRWLLLPFLWPVRGRQPSTRVTASPTRTAPGSTTSRYTPTQESRPRSRTGMRCRLATVRMIFHHGDHSSVSSGPAPALAAVPALSPAATLTIAGPSALPLAMIASPSPEVSLNRAQ